MRMTKLQINTQALLHNLNRIAAKAPQSKVVAMVKANAYGCGLPEVIATLTGKVGAFGVACIAEAQAIRKLGVSDTVIVFEGAHQPLELEWAAKHHCEMIVYHQTQLEWLKQHPTSQPIKVWIKINTGMNRLGFRPAQLDDIHQQLKKLKWVDAQIGLMTHFACADEPSHHVHQHQLDLWHDLVSGWHGPLSACNSAALWSSKDCLGTHVRPGIALYGVSPLAEKTAKQLDLKPVMQFTSGVMSIFDVPAMEYIGYSATHQVQRASKIAIVPVGYGDGYPRHIQPGTVVSVAGHAIPIVGRVSMDKITLDVTEYPSVVIGDPVELWGDNIPIEYVAKQSGTIPYELMCQVGPRERILNLYFK